MRTVMKRLLAATIACSIPATAALAEQPAKARVEVFNPQGGGRAKAPPPPTDDAAAARLATERVLQPNGASTPVKAPAADRATAGSSGAAKR